jgi:cytochrome P450
MGVSASTPSTLPPSPSEPPLVQTLRWLNRPVAFMESCRRRCGENFSVNFLGFKNPTVMLSNPEAIRALYTEHKHGLPPGRSVALLPVMGASSVLLLEGAEHMARRKAMLPAFHGERMRSYEGTMREVTEREIESWPQDGVVPFALHPRMQAITLEVILRAVFGVSDSARAGRLRELLPGLLGQSGSAGLQFRVLLSTRLGRGDPMAEMRRLGQDIDEVLLAEIAERRLDPGLAQREDVLSLMMSARMEDGEGMSDRELRDQLVTLLLAGHETTATALAWTLDLLLHNPAALARLQAEVDDGASPEGELAGNGASGAGGEGAGAGEYMRAVISESLRLRPVVPLAGRRLAVDLDAGDLHLPAGTDVSPAIWLTHTRQDIYPEPYAFRPERFLEDPPATYSWVPFGGGVRRCLGASFAEFEMRVVLETVLRMCALEPVSGKQERIMRRNVTFSPREGMRVRARRRGARTAARPAPAEPVAA